MEKVQQRAAVAEGLDDAELVRRMLARDGDAFRAVMQAAASCPPDGA